MIQSSAQTPIKSFLPQLTAYLLAACFPLMAQASTSTIVFEPIDFYSLEKSPLPAIDCGVSQNCYSQAEARLISHKKILFSDWQELHEARNKASGHSLVLVQRKTPVVVLFLHGLYLDSSQFYWEAAQLAASGINSVLVTLPGHAPFEKNHDQLKYNDWLSFVSEAARYALQFGDRLFVVGHSTGGLLSFYLSMQPEFNVGGQFLLEPALKVRSYLENGTCLGRSLISKAQDLGGIAELLAPGIGEYPTPVSLNMGCQVHRLAKKMFAVNQEINTRVQVGGPPGREVYKTKTTYRIPPNSPFYTMKVPTMVAFGKADSVVDPSATLEFLKVSPVAEEFVFDSGDAQGSAIDHGYFIQNSMKKKIFRMAGEFFESEQTPIMHFLDKSMGTRNYRIHSQNYSYMGWQFERMKVVATNQREALFRIREIYENPNQTALTFQDIQSLSHLTFSFKNNSDQCKLFKLESSSVCFALQFMEFVTGLEGVPEFQNTTYSQILDRLVFKDIEQLNRDVGFTEPAAHAFLIQTFKQLLSNPEVRLWINQVLTAPDPQLTDYYSSPTDPRFVNLKFANRVRKD
jgi:alpha-beta hydrolase superfamily lysophospholipase